MEIWEIIVTAVGGVSLSAILTAIITAVVKGAVSKVMKKATDKGETKKLIKETVVEMFKEYKLQTMEHSIQPLVESALVGLDEIAVGKINSEIARLIKKEEINTEILKVFAEILFDNSYTIDDEKKAKLNELFNNIEKSPVKAETIVVEESTEKKSKKENKGDTKANNDTSALL